MENPLGGGGGGGGLQPQKPPLWIHPCLCMLYNYLEKEELPEDDKVARKLVAQALHFAVVDGILYFVDPKGGGRKRVAVPDHHREGFYVRAMVVYWLGTFLEPNCIKL